MMLLSCRQLSRPATIPSCEHLSHLAQLCPAIATYPRYTHGLRNKLTSLSRLRQLLDTDLCSFEIPKRSARSYLVTVGNAALVMALSWAGLELLLSCAFMELAIPQLTATRVSLTSRCTSSLCAYLTGHGMPSLQQYVWLTTTLADALGWRHVHLQTSSANAFTRFLDLSSNVSAAGTREAPKFAFTQNARSDRDVWGGWAPESIEHNITHTTMVAVVNQYISSLANAFVSLSSSAWTSFVALSMRPGSAGRGATTVFWLCCKCRSRDLYISLALLSNVEVAFAEPPSEAMMQRINESLRERMISRGSASEHKSEHVQHTRGLSEACSSVLTRT